MFFNRCKKAPLHLENTSFLLFFLTSYYIINTAYFCINKNLKTCIQITLNIRQSSVNTLSSGNTKWNFKFFRTLVLPINSLDFIAFFPIKKNATFITFCKYIVVNAFQNVFNFYTNMEKLILEFTILYVTPSHYDSWQNDCIYKLLLFNH